MLILKGIFGEPKKKQPQKITVTVKGPKRKTPQIILGLGESAKVEMTGVLSNLMQEHFSEHPYIHCFDYLHDKCLTQDICHDPPAQQKKLKEKTRAEPFFGKRRTWVI